MWNVVQFPRTRIRDRSSGIRVALLAERWCVERLVAGDIDTRRPMPSEADARRIAARISRRDKVSLLPTYRHRRGHHTPDDAA